MTTSVLMSAANEPAKAIGGRKLNEAGQPIQRFSKTLIRVGEWVHPATGAKISVDASRLSHWVDTFNEMSAAGIRVPVPSDHTRTPDANRGWVVSMSSTGTELRGVIEMIGEDAIRMAGRIDCSISITERLETASGVTFIDAIDHVALVSDPAIPGLGSFQAIELSKAKRLGFARSPQMEALKAIAAQLGISAEGLDEAALSKAITDKIAEWKMMQATVEASKAEADAAKKELSTAQAQVSALQLSAGKPVDVDPDVIDSASRRINDRLERLVSDGKVTPAVRTKLSAAIVGTTSSPNKICLSRKAATAAGLDGPLGDAILDALNELPAKTSEGKGARVELSRSVPADNQPDLDPDLDKRIARAAGVPFKK